MKTLTLQTLRLLVGIFSFPHSAPASRSKSKNLLLEKGKVTPTGSSATANGANWPDLISLR